MEKHIRRKNKKRTYHDPSQQQKQLKKWWKSSRSFQQETKQITTKHNWWIGYKMGWRPISVQTKNDFETSLTYTHKITRRTVPIPGLSPSYERQVIVLLRRNPRLQKNCRRERLTHKMTSSLFQWFFPGPCWSFWSWREKPFLKLSFGVVSLGF